jgi:hypothetical protein
MRTTGFIQLSAAAVLFMAVPAQAGPLSFVEVAAPDINCVFNTTCKVTVTDSVGTIVVPPGLWSGTARLQSRTYPGAAGAPGAGKTAYEYRVDLTQAVSDGEVPCVTDIAIDFGAVTKLQYNKVGPLDDVFVVTKGGLGTIGLYAVEQTGNVITFTFNQPVCAGPTPRTGRTSYFFGLASEYAPHAITAHVGVPGLLPVDTPARGPAHGAALLNTPAAPSGLRAN